MTTEYSVRVEYRTRDNVDEQLLDALAAYHPATGRGLRGWVEVYLTVPAEDFVQLAHTTIALTGKALGAPVLAIEFMPQDEFDARLGLEPIPELLSVSEAAEMLHVSRQAVLQRIANRTLPATRIGNAWAIQRERVRREIADAEDDALAAVAGVARALDPAADVRASMVLLHCDRCDEVHRLAVAHRPDPASARVLETCWCPRARDIVQGSHRLGTD